MTTIASLLSTLPSDTHAVPQVSSMQKKVEADVRYWGERGGGVSAGRVFDETAGRLVVMPDLDRKLKHTRLQAGPSCGLAAAWIASDALGGGGTDVDEPAIAAALLDGAKARCGPENQGEMFDARDLASVAEEVLPVQVSACSVAGEEGAVRLVHHVAGGGAALVPYDVDASGDPTEAGGSKAHWCAIVGIVTREPSAGAEDDDTSMVSQDGPLPSPLPSPDDVLFVLLQPKSRHVRFVSPRALFRSSVQLSTACEAVGAFAIDATLAGRALLLSSRLEA